jgi:hypothetical protein
MIVSDRLDILVLARTSGAKPLRVAEVAKAIARFVPDGDLAVTTRAHARLVETGAITGGRTDPDHAPWAALGLRGAAPWQRVVERVVPGLGLGVAADDARAHGRLTDRDAWAAAIVARVHGLWADGAPPTLSGLCDALVWRGLGLPGAPKRTPPEIRALFAGKLTGEAGAHDKQIRLAAAVAVGALRTELRLVRDALGRKWLEGLVLGGDALATAAPPPPPVSAVAVDLGALASDVKSVARAATDGVFGDRKVFISAVWQGLASRAAGRGLDLPAFKQHLVAAHKAGLVSLVRADLVGAMDPALVAASETADGDARFHFVVREVSS